MGDPISGLVGGGLKAAGGAAKGGGKGGGGGGSGQDSAQAEWQHMQDLQKIRARYADLGLGGSTMESMDEAGAGLGFLAQQEGFQQSQQQLANDTLRAQTGALGSLTNIANQNASNAGFAAGSTPGAATTGAAPAVST